MAETSKSQPRRLKEGFFEKYVVEPIIDIGVGRIDTYDGADPLTPDCDTWDKDNGNAVLMTKVKDSDYNTVYNSHLLEHLNDPITAIKNWFRILKKDGHLIICVPDRDSYERKTTLPSKWNGDHKFFITADRSEPPCTFSLKSIIDTALRKQKYKVVKITTINTCTNLDKPNEHGDGEYQIEAIIKKLK